MAWVSARLPWKLLCAAALTLAASPPRCSPRPGEATCSNDDAARLARAKASLASRVLEVAVLADDSVSVQVVWLLQPRKIKTAPLRLRSYVTSIRFAQLLEGWPGGPESSWFAVLTSDGAVAWYAGSSNKDRGRLERREAVQHDQKFSALSVDASSAVLALGDRAGHASLWHPTQAADPSWQMTVSEQGAHHEWEKVRLVVASPDGKLLLASTEDNVLLWRVDGSSAEELRHQHGGTTTAVAVADMANIGGGAYLVAMSYQSGTFEGWRVDPKNAPGQADPEDAVVVLWSTPPTGVRVTSILAADRAAGFAGSIVVVGDVRGKVMLWQKDPWAAPRAQKGDQPAWEAQPNDQGHAAMSLALLSPPGGGGPGGDEDCFIAAGFTNQVAVLDCATGEILRSEVISGSPLDVRWRAAPRTGLAQ